eukprot:CAMPEP_0171343270 /NCGR_PEP_ID=MMETSP0878-20121228/16701_1 /TAXON_ID=67004 /ORGANISM="Thalassiosira weissflogii, Strain CCMP1336" /LENGTH=582 /DNA_ID=CAMNT_0011846181 /DNA_START=125 /DNA_END=1873 /DNA_ORIENTATION=+
MLLFVTILGVQGAHPTAPMFNLHGIKSYATNKSTGTHDNYLRIHNAINIEYCTPLLLSTASSAAATALCLRGGSTDDGSRRRNLEHQREGDRYHRYNDARKRPPSRRPLPSQYDLGRSRPGPGRPDGPRTKGDMNRGHDRYDEVEQFFDDTANRSRPHARYRESGDDRARRREIGYDAVIVSGKSEGRWFKRKNGPAIEQNSWDLNAAVPPPPPTPPLENSGKMDNEIKPAQSERTPIHYMFPTAEAAAEERLKEDRTIEDSVMDGNRMNGDSGNFDIPFLEAEEENFLHREKDSRGRRQRMGDDEEDGDGYGKRRLGESGYASPRRDAVTLYMSTKRGALKIRLGSMIVGAGLGAFIGKSLLNDPYLLSSIMSFLLFFSGFLRNDYGELSRALGLAFLLTLKRTTSVRKDYPTLPHLKALIRQGPRKPFPPTEDGGGPWQYQPVYEDDPDFKMTYALLAMAMVGSFCGGNVPLLPAWMGGIIGALAFASLTTGSNARGDLGRSMGMRVVGLFQVVLTINSELKILSKTATVGGLIFDKIMIMDRKHKIKDKIVAICRWGYDKVSRTASQIQEDMQQEARVT